MNRHTAFLVFLGMLFGHLATPSFALLPELREAVLNREILVSSQAADTISPPISPITLVARVTSLPEGLPFNGDLISAVVKEKMNRSGHSVRIFRGDFLGRISISGNPTELSSDELWPPKFLIEIKVEKNAWEEIYRADCWLSFIHYARGNVTPPVFLPKLAWTRELHLPAASLRELEEKLPPFLRSAVDDFTPEYRVLLAQYEGASSARRLRKTQVALRVRDSTLALSKQRASETFSPKLSNGFRLGATLGTPAWINLLLGYWGNPQFPLTASFSGMYLGKSRRGVQLESGWLFDPSGSAQQSLGFSLALRNETTSSQRLVLDSTGQNSVETTSIDRLRFFLGPVYTFQWRSFRVQAGPAIRLGAGAGSDFTATIQIGYTPEISL